MGSPCTSLRTLRTKTFRKGHPRHHWNDFRGSQAPILSPLKARLRRKRWKSKISPVQGVCTWLQRTLRHKP